MGVDPSATATGLVALDLTTARVVKEHCIETKKTGASRLVVIHDEVCDFLSSVGDIAHVCMEGYSFGYGNNNSQSHKLGEVGGVIKYALLTNSGIYPTLIASSQAKKFCLGKASKGITKSMILKQVDKKWGFDTYDDNVADAYVEARIARAIELGTTEHVYEAEVLKSALVNVLTEAPQVLRDAALARLSYRGNRAPS